MPTDSGDQNDFFPSFFNDNRFFGNGNWMKETQSSFKADVQETEEEYKVTVDLPGFNKKDIHIEFNRDTLLLQATRKAETEERRDESNYLRQERSYGSITRQFQLRNVEEDNISASYNEGVLVVTLPKKPGGSDSKRIAID